MALPEKINLEIVTPEKHLFSGQVDSVTVPSNTGYLGILPGHAPLLAELGIGEISFSWGFLEVLPDRVVLLAQTAELASDIDTKRAEEAKVRAEKLLSARDPNIDFRRAELALLRAIARLNAAKRREARR